MSEAIRPDHDSRVRSRGEARAWFKATGTTVSDWAKRHGFQREHVYAVLAGRTCGDRGHAHAVAMALRIKPPPPSDFEPDAPLDDGRREEVLTS